jgi:hypothetical protein
MRGISVECLPDGARLHFVLERHHPADREEIEDIAFEFEAVRDRCTVREVVTLVSGAPDAISLPGRRVYGRKDRTDRRIFTVVDAAGGQAVASAGSRELRGAPRDARKPREAPCASRTAPPP